MNIKGWRVRLPKNAPITVPTFCARCGDLNGTHRRAARWRFRPVLNYLLCRSCARRRMGRELGVVALGIGLMIGAMASGLSLPGYFSQTLFPRLSPSVLLVLPALLFVLLGLGLHRILVWMPSFFADSVQITAHSAESATVFCVHEGFTQTLAAQARGARAEPTQYRDGYGLGLLAVLASIVPAAVFSYAQWESIYIKIHVDNAGREPMEIWADGRPVFTAPGVLERKPAVWTLPLSDTVESFRLPVGDHQLGHSVPGAKAPAQTIAIHLSQAPYRRNGMGYPALYNPQASACYAQELAFYRAGRTPATRPAPPPIVSVAEQGLLVPREFYLFQEVDYWFEDLPRLIEDNHMNGRWHRVGIFRFQPCEELNRMNCRPAVRDAYVQCYREAGSEQDQKNCWAEAVQTCRSGALL